MAYSVRQNPSPMHWKGRYGRKISKIVIHHAATTDFDGIGRTFQGGREVSAHYGVGRNNNVDQYVQEGDTAWHSGNGETNLQSIGIENVNSSGAPNWDVAPETFSTLVELVRDIANRNGLLPLVVGKNLIGHKDVTPTACPGQLYGRLQELADAVNNGTAINPPAPQPPSSSATDQILAVGSNVQFAGQNRVDALAFVGGIWQIQTNRLCPKGFTWNDNGIPAGPVTEVAGGAGNPNDQVLQVGSLYNIPGKYRVNNLGPYQDRWMVQLTVQGWTFWVDAESLTEVA